MSPLSSERRHNVQLVSESLLGRVLGLHAELVPGRLILHLEWATQRSKIIFVSAHFVERASDRVSVLSHDDVRSDLVLLI